MRTEFEPEQLALRDSTRRLLDAELGGPRLRALWDTDTGRDPRLYGRFAEIGLPALLVPESHDGLGADELDMFGVLEEVGRAAVPDAVLEAWLIAPALLTGASDVGFAARWLPRMASGETRATVLSADDLAPDAHVSDLLLKEVDGDVVAWTRDEVGLTREPTMDPSQRLYRVAARAAAGTVIGGGGLELARSRRRAGSAALLIGLSTHLLGEAVAHAGLRTQFGRLIGSFQAVKHLLADAHSRVVMARHAAVAATCAVAARGPSHGDESTLAQLCALEAAAVANRVALQVHGGIGFTWEHDLQIWLKAGKTLELGHGTRREAAVDAGQAALDVADAGVRPGSRARATATVDSRPPIVC